MIKSNKGDQTDGEYEDFFQIIVDLKEKLQQLNQENNKSIFCDFDIKIDNFFVLIYY